MSQRKAAAVSMENDLFKRAKKRAADLGFPTFSAYMVQLLRADLIARGELNIREETGPAPVPPCEEVVYQPAKRSKKQS
jgi:hypothetical protein